MQMTPIKRELRNHIYTTEPPEDGVWVHHNSTNVTDVIKGHLFLEHQHHCYMTMADLQVRVKITPGGHYSFIAGCHIGEERVTTVKSIKLDNGKTRPIKSLAEAKQVAELLYALAMLEAQNALRGC